MALSDSAAYPCAAEVNVHPGQMGMTFRQDAAIKILAGLVSNPAVIAQDFREGWTLVNCSENYIAGYAVKLADELISKLEER